MQRVVRSHRLCSSRRARGLPVGGKAPAGGRGASSKIMRMMSLVRSSSCVVVDVACPCGRGVPAHTSRADASRENGQCAEARARRGLRRGWNVQTALRSAVVPPPSSGPSSCVSWSILDAARSSPDKKPVLGACCGTSRYRPVHTRAAPLHGTSSWLREASVDRGGQRKSGCGQG